MDISKIKVKYKTRTSKRAGRGTGSGWGKTGGRGYNGAGQRSGKKLPYIGFNGGNLPYFRKIPKRGFKCPTNKGYQIVNLADITARVSSGAKLKEINAAVLADLKLIKDPRKPVKILARVKDAFSLKADFAADMFSKAAVKYIESAGGKVSIVCCEKKTEEKTEAK